MPTSELISIGGFVGPILVAIIAILGWCLKHYIADLKKQVRNLTNANKKLTNQLSTAIPPAACTNCVNLQKQVNDLGADVARVTKERDTESQRATQLEVTVSTRDRELLHVRKTEAVLSHQLEANKGEIARLTPFETKAQYLQVQLTNAVQTATVSDQRIADLEPKEQELQKITSRVNHVLTSVHRVWEEPVAQSCFRPLSTDRPPIISVLNLKGGVGKTTITAGLAGVMAACGEKVLMIDADYQRSLSMLTVSNQNRTILHFQAKTLQHFFMGNDHSSNSLVSRATATGPSTGCWIVTNSEPDFGVAAPGNLQTPFAAAGLDVVETRLMVQWMLQPDKGDVRTLLQQALYDRSLNNYGFNYILIDCPPRLTTACINALIASDFVLIPMIPDATSALAVINLLRILTSMKSSGVFPDLKILGVLANTVRLISGKLVSAQQKTWGHISIGFDQHWDDHVPLFNAMIPHSLTFAQAASAGVNPPNGIGAMQTILGDQSLNNAFSNLHNELKTRIANASQQPAPVPPKPASSPVVHGSKVSGS